MCFSLSATMTTNPISGFKAVAVFSDCVQKSRISSHFLESQTVNEKNQFLLHLSRGPSVPSLCIQNRSHVSSISWSSASSLFFAPVMSMTIICSAPANIVFSRELQQSHISSRFVYSYASRRCCLPEFTASLWLTTCHHLSRNVHRNIN